MTRDSPTTPPLPPKRIHNGPEIPSFPARRPGLIVFDMDSTLIQQETIDELARLAGDEVFSAVKKITHDAMSGTSPMTFSESLVARLKLLKGLDGTTAWRALLGDGETEGVFRFTTGVKVTVEFLKAKGWKVGVLSGGFREGVEWVKEQLGLDYAFANELRYNSSAGEGEGEGRKLAGRVVNEDDIVDGAKKKALMLDVAHSEGVEVKDTVAVGDGSNDIPMILASGLGIAFNAKPKVQDQAPNVLNTDTMVDLLYMLGYSQDEVEKATSS